MRTLILKWLWRLAFATALCASVFSPASAAPSYDEILAQAKADASKADLTALRDAYARTAQYDPYGIKEGPLRNAMINAFSERDCGNALRHAQEILDRDYVHIDAHFASALCYARSGNKPKEEHHRAMALGLIDSILASGDGTTPETAFVVVAIYEEYSVISRLGLKKVRQALIEKNGHGIDVFTVEDQTGATAALHFNVDRLLIWSAQQGAKSE